MLYITLVIICLYGTCVHLHQQLLVQNTRTLIGELNIFHYYKVTNTAVNSNHLGPSRSIVGTVWRKGLIDVQKPDDVIVCNSAVVVTG